MQPALDVSAPQHRAMARSAPVPDRLTFQRCKSLSVPQASTCRCGVANHFARRKPALDLSALQISARKVLSLVVCGMAIYGFGVLCLSLGLQASQ